MFRRIKLLGAAFICLCAAVQEAGAEFAARYGGASSGERLRKAIVTIGIEGGGGAGFFVFQDERYFVLTNAHILGNLEAPLVKTHGGETLEVDAVFVACDRNLAMIPLPQLPEGCKYIPLFPKDGFDLREGSGIAAFTSSLALPAAHLESGKALSVDGMLVESDFEINQANSGSPLFHAESGAAAGVYTFMRPLDIDNRLAKHSLQKGHASYRGDIRYYAIRADNVAEWLQTTHKSMRWCEKELDAHRKKLELYDGFDAEDPGNSARMNRRGNLGAVSPELYRIAVKLNDRRSQIDVRSQAKRRLGEIVKDFYREYETLLSSERRKLIALKLPAYLEEIRAEYLGVYDRLLADAKERAQ